MITIPDKKYYTVEEVAGFLARAIGIKKDAAKKRIYRAEVKGRLILTRMLGGARISKEQALKILKDEI